jgi:hypothetical protein
MCWQRTIDYSTGGAYGALLPIRQSGGLRQGRACHPFRGSRDVKHVRQTLSDVSAYIGDVEQGFPDREGMRGRRHRSKHAFGAGCAAPQAPPASGMKSPDGTPTPRALYERVAYQPRFSPQTSRISSGRPCPLALGRRRVGFRWRCSVLPSLAASLPLCGQAGLAVRFLPFEGEDLRLNQLVDRP